LTCAAIVLAAGEASRMGQLKQLLPFGSGTLLTHVIDVAREAGFEPILVVVGALGERVEESIRSLAVEIVHNPDWKLGMGSSISTGVKRIDSSNAREVAILLGDQPQITAAHLIQMQKLFESVPAAAVAAEYNGTLGVPAIFKRELFGRLAGLAPEAGAKSILLDPELSVVRYQLPEAAVDIDTPEDFAKQCSSEWKQR
jgi:molybdenum cofactor cytidylyltransferase